jgi:two-component system OmpR family sensor kinase
MSDLDSHTLGNLAENALRHGFDAAPAGVPLTPDGQLIIANDGPVMPPETPERLTPRFGRTC